MIEKCKVISLESHKSINNELMIETLNHEIKELNCQNVDLELRLLEVIQQCEEKTKQLSLEQLKNEDNIETIESLQRQIQKSCFTNRDIIIFNKEDAV